MRQKSNDEIKKIVEETLVLVKDIWFKNFRDAYLNSGDDNRTAIGRICSNIIKYKLET